MRLNYKRFIDQASSFPFSPLSDRLSLRMSDYAADLERKVASFERAWAQVCALVDQLCSTMSALRADYSAFGMPVHLTFLSGQRRVFLSSYERTVRRVKYRCLHGLRYSVVHYFLVRLINSSAFLGSVSLFYALRINSRPSATFTVYTDVSLKKC
ncbi:unnamed protein product [Schistocephalus solidus]|uniref:DHC_N1 domain-containing protein n=1 Tax=Schistocephalus solidus TaxID=70667 RepID=A0A183SFC5_SCHSO|nr:unnamed protein product [Schistocephalus solidus]